MALVGRFCAVGWTEEFADYPLHLAVQLSSGDLAASAIQILTSLSVLRESAWVFIDIGRLNISNNFGQTHTGQTVRGKSWKMLVDFPKQF
jgi:hypothetical protein